MIYKNKLIDFHKFDKRIEGLNTINKSFCLQENFAFSHVDKISSSSQSTTISASSSNEIEGIVESQSSNSNNEAKLLNHNYNQVLLGIKENYKDLEITPELILDLHKNLFVGMETVNQPKVNKTEPGKFKTKQNYIVNENREIIFTPSSPIETPEQILNLCNWYNNAELNPILKSLIFIFDFIAVHPFNDGNGRISRLLTNLLLLKSGVEFIKYIPLEKYILEHKDEYMIAIAKSQLNWKEDNNEYDSFINFHYNALESCWEDWKEIINHRSFVQQHKINKIGEVLMIIKKLRDKFIPITKANIAKQAYLWQSNINEPTLKDIIFNLSKANALILTKQSRISFYDINYDVFDQWYDKYITKKIKVE